MKLSVVSLALMAIAAPASAVVGMDAKSAGAGYTGIASGDFTRAPLNPALLTRFQESDDLYIRLGVNALAKEYEDALDQVDDTQDAIERFEDKINAMDPNDPPTQADADALLRELEALDNTRLVGEANLDLGIFAPSKKLAWGLTIGGYVVGNGDFDYDDNDRVLVEQALVTGVFDPDQLQSEGVAHAVVVSEVALNLAREFKLPSIGEFSVGVSPKYQRLDTYLYRANINNYDNDDYFEDEYLSDDSGFNLDLGFYKSYGNWRFGLVGYNLIKHSIDNVEGNTISLEPTYAAAVAWQKGIFGATVEADLVEDESFVVDSNAPQLLQPRQMVRTGLELTWTHIQLRGGYVTDLSDNYEDLLTVGLGITPWDSFSLDLAAQFGDDEERGAALQLGWKF
ncbi:conjugal transfer protein TraF [Ferrimonas sp. YFM]|uniref:conjugal transfer protein TraF n=1 Tax=Ferrimonas sp. YFM TaxID=3028878 RepID=UPI0025745DC4|nr:conjugal transfer protein TraF [Ferrimonas sp. YFM]